MPSSKQLTIQNSATAIIKRAEKQLAGETIVTTNNDYGRNIVKNKEASVF